MEDVYFIRNLVQLALRDATSAEARGALASRWGVSIQYITDVARGYRDPGKSILKALGYERVIQYRRIDDDQPDRP